jgi:hypothetical protein
MRHLVVLAAAAAIVGCSSEQKPADTATPAAATIPPAAPAIQLADVAGKWTVVGKDATTDSTLATYVLDAPADTSQWTITFPNRPPVKMHVLSVAGDSIVTRADPYESVLRKGVQVTLDGVSRLKDGKLVGTSVAHYNVKTADSVRNIKMEGTRNP